MADASSQQSFSSSENSREDSNSQDETKQTPNVFRNDGSFMEMFKKMQEDQKRKEEEPKGSASKGDPPSKDQPNKRPALSFVGKRRGGRILATGMVKKQRREAVPQEQPKPVEGGKTDAWSQYMNEVRKYKEQSCEEEGKRRPLVK